MPTRPVTVSPIVRQRAEALGPTGRAWLRDLPDLLAELERQWGIEIREPLGGGTAAYVVEVVMADGCPAVAKVAVPDPDFGRQVRTLQRAGGRGYVQLLGSDLARGAVLLEALGPSLTQLSWSPERQLTALCTLLTQAWRVPMDGGATAEPPLDKAAALHAFVAELPEAVAWPGRRVIDTALRFAARRAAAFDPNRCVVVHGDAAAANVLQVRAPRPGAPGDVVFVDPDGFVGDPAYDLGVALRDWSPELLAGDAPAVARHYCALLADASGVDEDAIWEWGFLERVSTGLFLLSLGAAELAHPFLATAELLM